jgi:sterol desaturase/sphingolipid hydroxylase (fatty acid hydroxylase superfamily)
MFKQLVDSFTTPPVNPLESSDEFWWVYIVFAFLIGAIVLLARARPSESLLPRLLPPEVFLHRSALLDYRYIATTHVLTALTMGLMGPSIVAFTQAVSFGLTALFGPNDNPIPATFAMSIAYTAATFIALDAATFFAHYLEHRLPILWEFHKVHHAAEVLTPATALRVHPVSRILHTQMTAIFLALTNGVFLRFYGGRTAEITVLGANAFFVLYHTAGLYHLAHSHIWLMFPKGIREVVCSPALHLIHHSRDRRHHNKNFGLVLTIWDRLAGTLYMPLDEERHTITFGLEDHEGTDLTNVRQLYLTPFRRAAALLWAYRNPTPYVRPESPQRFTSGSLLNRNSKRSDFDQSDVRPKPLPSRPSHP